MEDLLIVGIGAERRSVAGGIVIRVMDSTGGFGRAMRGSPQKGIGRGLIRMGSGVHFGLTEIRPNYPPDPKRG